MIFAGDAHVFPIVVRDERKEEIDSTCIGWILLKFVRRTGRSRSVNYSVLTLYIVRRENPRLQR